MNEFLKWLSTNSTVAIALIIICGFLCIALAIIFVFAFIQGREISFWPPKIGASKDEKSKKEDNKNQSKNKAKSIDNEKINLISSAEAR